MEITGTVIAVLPKVSGVGQNGPWARQTVVIEYFEGEYPNKLALENSNKAEEFGRLQVGDQITAKFNVTSREYQGKWYTGTRCYSWNIIGSTAAAPAQAAAPAAPAAPAAAPASAPATDAPAANSGDGGDDLPF